MSSIRLAGIQKRYGSLITLDGIELEAKEGEFITLLGASGSGKTTCLRIVAGFVMPDAGRVLIGDADVTRTPAHRRDTGMVFQQYALFPHLTVQQNVAFGLRFRKVASQETRKRVAEVLELVQMERFAARYPSQLSGGQKQRIALARAVVIRPKILLLDEPLGALDLKLREELQVEIKRVQQTLGITTLFVTHDQSEALSMSDRIALMRDGRILQCASPLELYERPVDQYVANFVGKSNFVAATVAARNTAGYTLVGADGLRFRAEDDGGRFRVGDACIICFRPEAVQIDASLANRMPVVVEKSAYSGAGWTLQCRSGTNRVTLTVPSVGAMPAEGATIDISWAPERTRLLQSGGG